MGNYLELVREKYSAIISDNQIHYASLSSCLSDMNYDNVDFAYLVCHPILGNLLEFGWARGEKTDTAAIRLSLLYCAYAGLVGRYNDNKGIVMTPEEFFAAIAQQDGLFNWCENACQIIGLSSKDGVAKNISLYFDQCIDTVSVDLPKLVNNEDNEIQCVDTCVAMFFVGKSIAY